MADGGTAALYEYKESTTFCATLSDVMNRFVVDIKPMLHVYINKGWDFYSGGVTSLIELDSPDSAVPEDRCVGLGNYQK